MWRKIVDCYAEWESEQIAVLEQPSLAAQSSLGIVRRFANQFAELSLVERQQMLQFSRAYQGRRGWIAVAKLLFAFTLAGIVLYLAFPGKGLGMAIAVANLCGLGMTFGLIGAWFNYRRIVQRKLRWACPSWAAHSGRC
jgi:hypothetical protein